MCLTIILCEKQSVHFFYLTYSHHYQWIYWWRLYLKFCKRWFKICKRYWGKTIIRCSANVFDHCYKYFSTQIQKLLGKNCNGFYSQGPWRGCQGRGRGSGDTLTLGAQTAANRPIWIQAFPATGGTARNMLESEENDTFQMLFWLSFFT